MIGMMMSPTSELTIPPKAAPMITPTAKSTTLPRMANSLNSLSIFPLPLDFGQADPRSAHSERRQNVAARHFHSTDGANASPILRQAGSLGKLEPSSSVKYHHAPRA